MSVLVLAMAGCDVPDPSPSEHDGSQAAEQSNRFMYLGRTIRLPAGEVEVRIDRSPAGAPAFARLRIDPRFDIVLDESIPAGMVFWVDQRRFGPSYRNAVQRDLHDGYKLVCGKVTPGLFYQCGAPLRWARGAGVLFRTPPTDAAAAREMIDKAETILARAERDGK